MWNLEGALCREASFLLGEPRPPARVLKALWDLVRGRSEFVYGGPLAELAGLAMEWDESADQPMLRPSCENALPLAGERFLGKRLQA
jgi:hypothetical protein